MHFLRHTPSLRHAAWLAGLFLLPGLAAQAQTADAAAASSATASAAAPAASAPAGKTGKQPSKGEKQAEIWFNMLDSNKDGYLSWDEVKHIAPLAKDFKAADTDGNGRVSRNEIRVLSNQRKAERRARKAAEAQAKQAQ